MEKTGEQYGKNPILQKKVKLSLWTVKAQHIEAKSDSWEGEENVECKFLPSMY